MDISSLVNGSRVLLLCGHLLNFLSAVVMVRQMWLHWVLIKLSILPWNVHICNKGVIPFVWVTFLKSGRNRGSCWHHSSWQMAWSVTWCGWRPYSKDPNVPPPSPLKCCTLSPTPQQYIQLWMKKPFPSTSSTTVWTGLLKELFYKFLDKLQGGASVGRHICLHCYMYSIWFCEVVCKFFDPAGCFCVV